MEDVLTKATADGVRIYALCTTNLVREAAKKHGCSHLASAALGRAMNGALLLAATMKVGALFGLGQGAVGVFPGVHQGDVALIGFRIFVQQAENPVSAGKAHNDGVQLHADLGDGHVEALLL